MTRRITLAALQQAYSLAASIAHLEAAKDQVKDEKHTFHLGLEKISVPVSADSVRRQIAQRVADATNELAAMGFELVPGAPAISGELLVSGTVSPQRLAP